MAGKRIPNPERLLQPILQAAPPQPDKVQGVNDRTLYGRDFDGADWLYSANPYTFEVEPFANPVGGPVHTGGSRRLFVRVEDALADAFNIRIARQVRELDHIKNRYKAALSALPGDDE